MTESFTISTFLRSSRSSIPILIKLLGSLKNGAIIIIYTCILGIHMKTLTRVLFLVILILNCTEAKEINYRNDINVYTYNSIWKKQLKTDMKITYDYEDKEFYFYIYKGIGVEGFALSREKVNLLIAAINKYEKWNIKASKKKVMLEKEITKFRVSNTFWKRGDEWYFGGEGVVFISFLSQSKQKHQLVFSFAKVNGIYNEFASNRIETLYLWYNDAIKLRTALTKKEIDSFLIKAKKQESLEAEFN